LGLDFLAVQTLERGLGGSPEKQLSQDEPRLLAVFSGNIISSTAERCGDGIGVEYD
jgi:hypothetical protein